MALKKEKVFTLSTPSKGVVLWDTTLRPLCKQLKEYDPEALSYMTLYAALREKDYFQFKTKSDTHYILQRNRRVEK
ncbi:MAG: hypothetical protein P8N44_07355 [Flavobacteriaceae bacterium]|nr:hypothetical protein [Flavobacteriaceae bacterium]MDG1927299.1 hypothetical protein [Flavobacteriaceae bacterium]